MGEVGGVAGTPEDHCQEKCPNVPGLQKLPREEGQGGPFPVKEKHEDRCRAHEGMTRRTVRRGREQGRGQKCGRKPAWRIMKSWSELPGVEKRCWRYLLCWMAEQCLWCRTIILVAPDELGDGDHLVDSGGFFLRLNAKANAEREGCFFPVAGQ